MTKKEKCWNEECAGFLITWGGKKLKEGLVVTIKGLIFHKDIGETLKKQVMKEATEQSAELRIS